VRKIDDPIIPEDHDDNNDDNLLQDEEMTNLNSELDKLQEPSEALQEEPSQPQEATMPESYRPFV